MIEKADLLSTLSTLLDVEEKGSALIVDRIETSIPEADVSDAERQCLVDVVEIIKRDTEGHMERLERIIEGARRDTRHAF